MSEYITHIAIQDDTARLALHSDEICQAFKLCFSAYAAAARMGSSSRGNSTFIVQNLHYFRDLWEQRKPEDRLEEQLAYTLGWITHRAADRYFKPRYGLVDKNPENLHPVDVRIYHDVVVYRKVYGNGKHPPFSRGYAEDEMASHPASEQIDVTQAEAIFGPMYQSELLDLQSVDQVASGKEFLERVRKQFATFTVDFNRLINLLKEPDPEDMEQMITAPNFYDENDPIIQLARNLQHGKSVEGLSLNKAMNTEGQSQYAQTLGRSFQWVLEGSRYFEKSSEIDKEDLFRMYLISKNEQIERY